MGHSLGEYTALACSNKISLKDCSIILKKRGELMNNEVIEIDKGKETTKVEDKNDFRSIESVPFFEWVYYILEPVDDQDAYSAAFKYLTDRGESELDLFRFKPEDKVDYHSAFAWFNNHPAPTGLVSLDDPDRRPFNPYLDILNG